MLPLDHPFYTSSFWPNVCVGKFESPDHRMPPARSTPLTQASSLFAPWQASTSHISVHAIWVHSINFSSTPLKRQWSPGLQREIKRRRQHPTHVAQRHVDIARKLKFEYEPLPPDPGVLTALKDSNEDPMTIFEASVARGSATVATAERCLEKVLALRDDLSYQDGQTALQQEQAGARILKWLWGSSLREAQDFVQMLSTMTLLCEAIVRERNEEFVWSWLQTESENFDEIPDVKYRWRSFLLASLVQAKLNVTPDRTANRVIQSLLEVRTQKQRSDFELFRTMSLKPAITMLQRSMVKSPFQQTDPNLWDQLIQLADLEVPRRKSQRHTAFNLVTRLQLYHPVAPNADPILQAWLSLPKEPSPYADQPKAQKAMSLDIIRAIAIFKSKKRDGDARILVDIAKDHLQADLFKKVESAYARVLPINISASRSK